MNTFDSIVGRRSVRKYRAEPVDPADVEMLLRAAMYAPSARDSRAWHFVVIADRAVLDKIPSVHPYAAMMRQAPLAIAVCGDMEREKRIEYLAQNCSAATQNILLAAHEAGLGSVWLGVYPNPDRMAGLVNLLDLPEHIVPISLIAVGRPAETPLAGERYDSAKIHSDTW